MIKVTYLIIGGGIAGTTTAEFIRLNDKSGSITIVMEEPELLYSRVMLPQYLRDQVPFERLFLRTAEQYVEKNTTLLKGLRTTKIDPASKVVTLSNGDEISYSKLLIASGGKVNKLAVPGADLEGVTYLRTVEDVKKIKKMLSGAKEAVVVGGGFIGIEYAQSFIKAGINTTAIVREPYFWSLVVGENSGKLIGKILEKNGVRIISNAQVTEFSGENLLEAVRLDNGQQINAQMAGVGIGIHMDLDHLNNSGIKINKGVVTNQFLETETPDVWAAGDIAEFYDVLFEKNHQMGNWSNAAAQGKVAGPNMVAGWGAPQGRQEFVTVSAYTISIFGTPFTFLGDPVIDGQTQVLERGSVEEGKLGSLHLRDDKIVGASLINLASDRTSLDTLIKNKVKITLSQDKLKDVNFSLANLIQEENG